jgi:hypothetical protein
LHSLRTSVDGCALSGLHSLRSWAGIVIHQLWPLQGENARTWRYTQSEGKKESGAFIMKVAPRRLEQPKEGD